jgi:hypothetical protein
MCSMIGQADSQLGMVTDAARMVPVERRDIFLQRVGAVLRMRYRFTDADLVHEMNSGFSTT